MPQQHTRPELDALTYGNLPSNTTGLIDPEKLREVLLALITSCLNLLDDGNPGAGPGSGTPTPSPQQATFGNLGGQAQDNTSLVNYLASLGHALLEFTPPMLTQARQWYLASTGIWEAKSSFNAQAPPAANAYWRLVVDFGDALTATAAGKALLASPTALAQRDLLDLFAMPAGAYGLNQPAFTNAYRDDGALVYLLRQADKLATQLASSVLSQPPAAPTAGQVDDQGDVFSFLPPAGYSFAQLKVAGLPNTTGAEWLNAANSYVQNGRIYVRVLGAVLKGGLAVYVGASGNVPDGQVLTNADPFTANNTLPTVPGALAVDFTVDNASLSPGDMLSFTAKATGGTTPYQHSVQALNPDTGTVTVLGTASTASYVSTWPKVPAGVYLVTDAVTDAAGGSLVSSARRVVVAAPGAGGGVPLVPATRTRLGGVRVGAGLDVDDDGVLSTEVQLGVANEWGAVQNFSKGFKLPLGGFVDEMGHFYIRQVDVGQKHFMFGPHYSLARDGLIQWKDSDFIGQDGNGDVGLARSAAGVLEVNTGTPGYVATLLSKDVVALAAPYNLNSITLLAQAVLDTGLLKGAKILWVCGGLSFYSPQRGNPSRPYPTTQQAHDEAFSGDLIIVQVGGTGTDALGRAYYPEDFLWTKNVRIIFQPGAIHGGLFQLARFGDTDPATLFKRQLLGGEFTNRTLAWRHSAGDLEIEVIGAKFTGNGNFEVAGGGSYNNNFLTSARLRNCLLDVNITNTTLGALRVTGRDDMGPVGLVLENTRVTSVRTPTLTFAANAASFVTLQGALTELVGTLSESWPTVPSGYVIAQKDWLLDQRPTSSAYTDAQARLAQLKRAAPANTTTVTLLAESAVDYGTAASGSYTVDGTGCVVGKEAWFSIGAGGSAPAFTNAPSGQPFDTTLAVFVPGKRNRYAVRVFPDCIEVLNVAS